MTSRFSFLRIYILDQAHYYFLRYEDKITSPNVIERFNRFKTIPFILVLSLLLSCDEIAIARIARCNNGCGLDSQALE